jgi:hypothetical protein
MMLMINIGYGQDENKFFYKENESFLNFPEGVIKNEMAFFTKKAAKSQKSFVKTTLNEIPLKKCSNNFVFFEKGSLYASEIIVSIESKNVGQSISLKEVFFTHYKYGFPLPDSVIGDIYSPVFCTEYTKKSNPIASCCKVYQSEDERRIYIYMLNSKGENGYEVTWVIRDDLYYTRVIDIVD